MSRPRAIVYGFGRAFLGVARRPLISALSIGAIGVALLLVGLVALAAGNVERMTQRFGRGVQMIIYLQDGVTPERALAIADILARVKAVEHVDYVPPDEAYHRLQETLGPRRDLLDGIEPGFLPASLEVKLADGVRELAAASPLVARLRHTPGVDEVEFLGDWVERLGALLTALRAAGIVLALLVGTACVYVVAGTIKLGMYARREELEILRLVGATDGFVRLPLLVEGALQGTIGAGVACGLLYAVYRFAAPAFERILAGAFGEVELSFLPQQFLLIGLGVGCFLGILGSWVAVGRNEA